MEIHSEFQIINNIFVTSSVLSNLKKFSKDTLNNHCEGLLYGIEQDNELLISTAIPMNFNQSNSSIKEEELSIQQYLELNRLDNMKLGYFLCSNQCDLIIKKNIKFYIDLLKKYEHSVIFFVDTNLLETSLFPFQCLRIHEGLLKLVYKIEIEDEESDILKKYTGDLFSKLSFKVKDDIYSLVSNKANLDENEEIRYYDEYSEQRILNKKMYV